jgi:hypothetical protein
MLTTHADNARVGGYFSRIKSYFLRLQGKKPGGVISLVNPQKVS